MAGVVILVAKEYSPAGGGERPRSAEASLNLSRMVAAAAALVGLWAPLFAWLLVGVVDIVCVLVFLSCWESVVVGMGSWFLRKTNKNAKVGASRGGGTEEVSERY